MTDIAPCPRCHYGAGPQGAERYWEARWRDEKANNDALVKALQDALCELSACAIQMGCTKGGSVHRAQIAARSVLASVSAAGASDK